MNFVAVNDQLASIAPMVRGCPTIIMLRAFSRAYRDWARQTQYLRVNISGATVADVQTYALGDDPYLDIVGVLAIRGTETLSNGAQQDWNLLPGDPSTWSPNTPTARPRSFCYLPQAQVSLFQVPDKVYSLLVTAIVQPKENAAQVPESALIEHRNGIESGTLAYLLNLQGQPWTDKVQAEFHRRTFTSSVSNTRAQVQRSFNTGSVRARPRPFIVGR